MIEIKESLDIALIEKLRNRILGRGLDDKDNLCYHQVMTIEGVPAGCARMYRAGTAVVVDEAAIIPELSAEYKEMLMRSMISHAVDSGCDTVCVYDTDDLYTEMGFHAVDGVFLADSEEIVFPCKCRKEGKG